MPGRLYLCAVMIKLLLELFVIYLLYKLIFDFILPVYHVSKQMNRKMNEFQQQMKEKETTPPPPSSHGTGKSDKDNDYIEYEEVK